MVLFSSFQDFYFPSVDRNSVIAVRNRDPPFGSDLNVKTVQTDRVLINKRIIDFVNSGGKNEILAAALEGHDGSLVDPGNFQIPDFGLDNIVGVVLVERINSLQSVEIPQNMVPRAINQSLLATFRLVYHQRKVVLFHLENRPRVPVNKRNA
jgi:hypothetical protein